MMSNYQRTMELTGYATNSAGASNEQFQKTMESLESKLNRLHDAWEEFTTGMANSSMIKGAVDLLTSILTIVNKVTDALDPLHTGLTKVLAAIFAFKGGKKILSAALGNIGVPIINKMGKNGEKAGLTFIQKMSAKMAKFNPDNITTLKNAGNTYAKQAKDLGKVSNAYKEYAAASRIATSAGATEIDISNERLKAAKLQQTLMDNLSGSERQQALLRMQNASAAELEASATEYADKAKKSDATATVLLNAAEQSEQSTTKMGLVTRLKYVAALLFGNQEKRLAAMQALGLASAEEIQAMATEGATAAQTSFNAALYACPLVWLIALVAAAIAVIALFVNAIKNYESEEEKRQARIKTLNNLVEESKNKADEAKEAFDNLLENRGTYNQLKDEIKALVEGSDEFIAKMNEINSLVNTVLENAPELGKYVTYDENGVATLSSEGWEKYSTILQQNEQKARISAEAYKVALNAEELAAASSNYENTAKYDTWENLDNGQTKKIGTFFQPSYYKKVDEIIDKYGDKFLEIDNESDLPSGYVLLKTDENDTLGVPQEAYDALAYVKKNYTTFNPPEEARRRGATSSTTLSGLLPANEKEGDTQLTSGTILRAIRSREEVAKIRDNKRESVINAYKAASAAYLMDKKGLSEDIATVYSNIISKRISSDLETINTDIKNTEIELPDNLDKLKQKYKDLFKIEYNPEDFGLDEDTDEDEQIKALKAAIAANQVISERLEKDWTAVQKATEDYEKFDDALFIISGKVADYADKELISALLNTASAADYFGNELNNYAEILGESADDFQNNFQKQWEEAQDSARQLVTKGANLFGINTISKNTVEAGVKQGYISKGQENLVGSEEYQKAVEAAYQAANQGVADFTKKIGPDLAVKFGDLSSTWLSEGFKTSSIFKNFNNSDILKNAENAAAFYNKIKDINFSTPIQAASKIRKLAQDTNKEYAKVGETLKEEAISLINSQKQVAQLYNEIDSDTWKNLLKDSKITREEINDLKDTLPDVITFLDNTGVSSETLAKYLEYVSSGMLDIVNTSSSFVEALDLINFATNNINDSIDFVENFKTSTTQTKIGDSFSDWREDISQALERGQYGDQALIDYSKMILGNDNWDKYYAEFEGNLQKVEELALQKINLWGENFYGLWQSFAGQNSLASLNSNGAISLDMSQISSLDDIKQALMETFDISAEVAEAAIADAQTYSNDFSKAIKQFSLGESLSTLISGALSIDGNTRIINENELQILADEAGQEVSELKKIILQAAEQQGLNIEFELEPMFSTDGSLADTIANKYAEQITEGLKKGSEGVNLDEIYTSMINAGLSEEQIKSSFSQIMRIAQKTINENPLKYADNGTSEQIYYYVEKGILKTTTSEETAKAHAIYASNLEEATQKGMLSGLTDPKVRLQEELTAIEEEKSLAKATAVGLRIGFMSFLKGGDIDTLASQIETKIGNAIDSAYKGKIADINKQLASIDTDLDVDTSSLTAALNNFLDLTPSTVTFYTNTTAQDAGISGGSWPDDSSSSNNDNDDEDDWTNDWNRQYALLKKIEALERERNKLDKEHDRWVKSYALMEDSIVESKEKQRKNLMKQIELNKQLAQNTRNELETLNWNSGFGGSIWFDQENNVIRTNDEHIRSMDKETKEAFDNVKSEYESLASQLESAQDNMDSAVEALEELTAAITEIDYQTQIDKLIGVIDNTLSLYEKAEARLNRSNRSTTSSDITNLFNAQSRERINKNNLLTESFTRAEAQINALLNMSDYAKYYNFDWESGKLTRNSAYYSTTDEDLLNKINTHIEKIESLAEIRRNADSERMDLQDEQYEAEKAIAERANEWQKKVYDAVVQRREEEIESLENINTSIQNSASKLVDSIQKNIQKIRQDRKNSQTEQEIADMQAKIAYLQIDTSTGNQVEIKKMQKQLSEKQESYTDSLIDQKITELQDQNKEAAEQRQKQIDIMKAQLSYDKQTGVIWQSVRGLIAAGLLSSGRIKAGSELDQILSKYGNVKSLNDYDRKEYWSEQHYGAASYKANDMISDSKYQDQLNYSISDKDYQSLYSSMASEVKNTLSNLVNETSPYKDYMYYNSSKNTLEQTELFPHPDDNRALNEALNSMWWSVWERINYINGLIGYFDINDSKRVFSKIPDIARYASGGLADFTGPAWLDGTTSKPEMVLNAKDTKNFIILKDILGTILKNDVKDSNNGDFYCNIDINVEKISNDYDVQQLADTLQQRIVESARYRNVNTINMIR